MLVPHSRFAQDPPPSAPVAVQEDDLTYTVTCKIPRGDPREDKIRDLIASIHAVAASDPTIVKTVLPFCRGTLVVHGFVTPLEGPAELRRSTHFSGLNELAKAIGRTYQHAYTACNNAAKRAGVTLEDHPGLDFTTVGFSVVLHSTKI